MDTNTLILLPQLDDPAVLPAEPLISAITQLQEVYIKRVIDTVNDLDNVLYEISNETPMGDESVRWQRHIIQFIRNYESHHKPKQHPILITGPWSENDGTLQADPAGAIYPVMEGDRTGIEGYQVGPPLSKGRRVILADTGHAPRQKVDRALGWKRFTRGLNPIFLDPYDDSGVEDSSKMALDRMRIAMGQTQTYAKKMNLAAMVPDIDLASNWYCLANLGTA
jgi:hypothetical protein